MTQMVRAASKDRPASSQNTDLQVFCIEQVADGDPGGVFVRCPDVNVYGICVSRLQ